MKQFKTLLIAVALTFGATSFANAQTKVAHIDVQKLMQEMPEFKEAQNQLEALGKTYDTELKEAYEGFQQKVQQYEAEAQTKTDEENAKRGAELQQTRASLGEYEQNMMKEMQQKRLDLIRPIMEKARTAIQKVAREKDFDYVLTAGEGSGILLAEGYDLMNDVKAELGI